ncbi:MAG: M17 family metallopeptidase [Bdellovibrionia bacterium]
MSQLRQMKYRLIQSRALSKARSGQVAAMSNKSSLDKAGTPGLGLECILAPLALSNSGLSALGLSSSHWSADEIQKQYVRKLRQLQSDKDETTARSLTIALSSGGQASFLFYHPEAKTFDLHSEMQKAFAELIKNAERDFDGKVSLDLRHLDFDNQMRALQAFVFLCETAHWEPNRFGQCAQKKDSKAPTIDVQIQCGLDEKEARAIVDRAVALGRANNEVRTLADLPANELNPANYRARIQAYAREHGLSFEFWDRKELARKKAGAFLAVTRADPNTSGGIAILKYVPRSKSKNRKKITLVGKGICFDTGGYNIKPGNYMLGMHGDMTGSALALALCGYFARTQADVEVHAYMALAENLISPTAYKPNEVVIASDGTSIEVVDTDAEGRMILADTLAFARKGKPDLLIDYATLTGAAIRALDRKKSAVFSHTHREDLAQMAVRCGDQSGERVWYFPLDADYRKGLKSKIADILQCSESSNADHIYAATFLSHFVGSETPWVHVDLVAGESKGGLGLIGTDTTGFGVLWTDSFVKEFLG